MASPTLDLKAQINSWSATLLERGWCIIPGLISPALIEALDRDLAQDFAETPFCEGGFYGRRTKRFGRLEQSVADSGRAMKEMTLDELETEWQRLKSTHTD